MVYIDLVALLDLAMSVWNLGQLLGNLHSLARKKELGLAGLEVHILAVAVERVVEVEHKRCSVVDLDVVAGLWQVHMHHPASIMTRCKLSWVELENRTRLSQVPADWSRYFVDDVLFAVVAVRIDLKGVSYCAVDTAEVEVRWSEVEQVSNLKECVESDLSEEIVVAAGGVHKPAQVAFDHQLLHRKELDHCVVGDRQEKMPAEGTMALGGKLVQGSFKTEEHSIPCCGFGV
jgi:hypothetical protein